MRLSLLEHAQMTMHSDISPADNDTICAISTPPGVGGIAVARVSGPRAIEITDTLWHGNPLAKAASHTAHLGTITAPDGQELDQCVATVFRTPRSFTGEEVVELAVHGSRFVQRELLNLLIGAGARLAEPGEFTRRAFIAGRMDLAEAEAVADVIASNSRASHRIAMSQMRGNYSRKLNSLRERLIDLSALLELELDFSEEDVEFASRAHLADLAGEIHREVVKLHRSFAAGSAIKDGIPVAIVGHTNAGKSSLLNALVGDDRAIVSDIHGTTRDTIEETLELGDYMFRFIDTAGLRDTADEIERKGIERSHLTMTKARIVILVVSATETPDAQLITDTVKKITESDTPPRLIVAINKTDVAEKESVAQWHRIIEREWPLCGKKDSEQSQAELTMVDISAKTEEGLDTLRQKLTDTAKAENGVADEGLLVTNARHAEALAAAAQSSARILESLDAGLSGDLVALDLHDTIDHLSTITSTITSTTVLSAIFSRFCIGK